MPKLCSIEMDWEDAPDTITPKELSKLRGMCIDYARDEFKKRGFPSFERYKARKSDLIKYYKIPTKKEEEDTRIVSELKKISRLLEVLAGSHLQEGGIQNGYE